MPLEIGKWIRGWRLDKLFDKDTDPNPNFISESAQQGVEIAEKVKSWINNPIADFLVNVIPGDFDKNISDKLKEKLPGIIAGLTGVENPDDIEEKLKELKFSSNYQWDKFFHDLAKGTAYALSDGKLTFADLTIAIQLAFDAIFGKKE